MPSIISMMTRLTVSEQSSSLVTVSERRTTKPNTIPNSKAKASQPILPRSFQRVSAILAAGINLPRSYGRIEFLP
jgi:hypothetical protein